MNMARNCTRARLGVEALEERQVLAAFVWLTENGVLNIRGSNGTDIVSMRQDDANQQFIVHAQRRVLGEAQVGEPLVFDSAAIRRVDIRLGDGNDRVDYLQIGSLVHDKTFNVNLGNGNDKARFDFGTAALGQPQLLGDQAAASLNLSQVTLEQASPTEPQTKPAEFHLTDIVLRPQVFMEPAILAPVRLQIQGGAGDDAVHTIFGGIANTTVDYRLFLDGGNDTSSLGVFGDMLAGGHADFRQYGGSGNDHMSTGNYEAHTLMAGATLSILTQGDAGHDQLELGYAGTVDGTLSLDTLGGQGNDFIEQAVTVNATSHGTVDSAVIGNAGHDMLTHLVDQDIDFTLPPEAQATANLLALLNGGTGDDNGTSNLGVNVLNVENHVLV